MTVMFFLIGLNKTIAQDITAAGESIGRWNGIAKNCNYPRGIYCIKPNQLTPSFDLTAFDNLVALGDINNIKNYINANNLESALGASATKGVWIGMINGLKNGTISLVKIKDVGGYEYMVGRVMPEGKYNTLVVKGFICHIVLYK